MNVPKRTLAIILIVLVGIVVAKDLIAQAAVSGGIKAITGLNSRIAGVRVGLLKTAVGIRGLRILNPSGFSEPILVSLPELYVDYKLGAFMKGAAHLERVRLYLEELHVVKNAQGELNLHAIKTLEAGKGKETAKPSAAGKPPALRIDVLELKIGRVVYTDETRSPAVTREFQVNIDERYEHITNPATFTGLVVSRALVKTTVGQLANFDVAGLQAAVSESLRQSAAQLTGTLTEGAQRARELGGQAAETATDAVNQATGTLKKLLGN